VRARVTEGLALAGGAKVAVSENAANGNGFGAGYVQPTATPNVTSVAITDTTGVITVVYTTKVGPATANSLNLTPTSGSAFLTGTALTTASSTTAAGAGGSSTVPTGGSITWTCAAVATATSTAAAVTNPIAAKSLPASCR
jgi:type IV pilus assembly protein PilA